MKQQQLSTKTKLKITDVGHATMLIQLGDMKILTDPWFTDPIMGLVTHPLALTMQVEDLPRLDLILISHGHFDHCDFKAISRLDKSASVIVADDDTGRRIRRAGFSDVSVLEPWQSKQISSLSISAFPAEHPVKECTYVISDRACNIYFGGDSRYTKELTEIGQKFDISVALLPVNGLSLPFIGRVVMDPAEAAEAALQLKARLVIPIHYNISLSLPGLKRLFDRNAPGTPEQFEMEMRGRNRHVKVVVLRPGEQWESA